MAPLRQRRRHVADAQILGHGAREQVLWMLQQLESDGNRCLLVLDGMEDWIDSENVRSVISDMMQGTQRLSLLLGSRVHVQQSFGGVKTNNYELAPLAPRAAAQLFLYRVHRRLYWRDLVQDGEERVQEFR